MLCNTTKRPLLEGIVARAGDKALTTCELIMPLSSASMAMGAGSSLRGNMRSHVLRDVAALKMNHGGVALQSLQATS